MLNPIPHLLIIAILVTYSGDAGQECCYNSEGNLVVGSRSGGSINRFAPVDFDSFNQHIQHDIIPYIYCCLGSCRKYYERRPSDDGLNYHPPPPGECVYTSSRNTSFSCFVANILFSGQKFDSLLKLLLWISTIHTYTYANMHIIMQTCTYAHSLRLRRSSLHHSGRRRIHIQWERRVHPPRN